VSGYLRWRKDLYDKQFCLGAGAISTYPNIQGMGDFYLIVRHGQTNGIESTIPWKND
jgi:hypothetical protein